MTLERGGSREDRKDRRQGYVSGKEEKVRWNVRWKERERKGDKNGARGKEYQQEARYRGKSRRIEEGKIQKLLSKRHFKDECTR